MNRQLPCGRGKGEGGLARPDLRNPRRAFSSEGTSTFGNGENMKTTLRLTLAAFGLAAFNLSTVVVQAQFSRQL
jgi:hypothetical protein